MQIFVKKKEITLRFNLLATAEKRQDRSFISEIKMQNLISFDGSQVSKLKYFCRNE